MSEVLTQDQIDFYNKKGYLIVENQIPDDVIANIRTEITRFEEEARGLTVSNDRLDLEDSHTPEAPRIRRIKLPHTISDVARDLMYSDHVLASMRDLIGPDLRLHTSKLNMKCAGYDAAVEWHQDFAFYPHTNDDCDEVIPPFMEAFVIRTKQPFGTGSVSSRVGVYMLCMKEE